MKDKKDKALSELAADLSAHGIEEDSQKISKRISNLKLRHKEKWDRTRTGNVPLPIATNTDRIMDKLMGSDNPTVNPLSFGISVGGE